MNTTTDMQVLDSLLALNLDISLWSARKKLQAEDFFGGATLPPEDLASLGSKKIADPESLRIFSTLKSRAFNFLDRHGVRFMGGWAIPEAKADIIVHELMNIRDAFFEAKENFLADYDRDIQAWVEKHDAWGDIIRNSTVSSDYVRSRIDFRWQLYKVAPVMQHSDNTVVLESGLAEEVTNLGNTLFAEISKEASDIWKRVYDGKTEVTHKALSPLRTLHSKLVGLAFVEPHVMPAADIIKAALDRMPTKKGNIGGADLLLLQGVVSMLRDPDTLFAHAHKILAGDAPSSVLADLSGTSSIAEVADIAPSQPDTQPVQTAPTTVAPSPTSTPTPIAVPSFGLW